MSRADAVTRADALLAGHGLMTRGSFVFRDDEAAPPALSGCPARSLVLVGHAGGSIWPHFRKWLAARPQPMPDPLDAWSKAVLDPVAHSIGARAVYPWENPYLPFQQWAMRAEGLKPSPLGILMHPRFGLWHAWRGALLFDVEVPVQAPDNPIHPCDLCDGKPCVNSCPAQAVAVDGLDAARCAAHLHSQPDSVCRTGGCIARAACPHDAFRYGAEQISFHQAAYLRGMDGS